MRFRQAVLLAMALLVASGLTAWAQEPMAPPTPAVPELFTVHGAFVRVAYNNEGYVTLSYRLAQASLGEEWMLLEMGVTIRGGTDNYKLKREHITLKTPDGRTIPLATQQEFNEAGGLRALNERAKVVTDSVNYFPVDATSLCAFQFFAQVDGRDSNLVMSQVRLSSNQACLGRLFFHVPGGIEIGQHWLRVQFADSVVEVPFRIFTEEEKRQFEKNWRDFKKEHEESWK